METHHVRRYIRNHPPQHIEVKQFNDTDECEFCGAIQGGYIIDKQRYPIFTDGYFNLRDGANCYACDKPESPL